MSEKKSKPQVLVRNWMDTSTLSPLAKKQVEAVLRQKDSSGKRIKNDRPVVGFRLKTQKVRLKPSKESLRVLQGLRKYKEAFDEADQKPDPNIIGPTPKEIRGRKKPKY